MTTEDHAEVVDALVNKNSPEYNHTKAAEELNELATVLLQKLNKKGGAKEPTDQEIIDELGDVQIRLLVLMQMYDPELEDEDRSKIYERMTKKMEKYKALIDEGKYKNI